MTPHRRNDEAWLDFLTPEDMCGLCAQHGIIDSRGKLMTPAGCVTGVRQFCICPNGQVMRQAWNGPGTPTEDDIARAHRAGLEDARRVVLYGEPSRIPLLAEVLAERQRGRE